MVLASITTLLASTQGQSPIVSILIGVLSASVTGAIVNSTASRRSNRRLAHHAAFVELRDAANGLRAAAKDWGEATKRNRKQLDSALVVAAARFDFARVAVPHWTVSHLAGRWKSRALDYYGGDESVTLDQESEAWRNFAIAWGDATRSTY